MKAFISHATDDREMALEAKNALAQTGISAFLAHGDLRVSQQWRDRILEELGSCDIFVALLSKAFRRSKWCSQELGAVIQRGTALVIPISLDSTKPYGFIADLQSHSIQDSSLTPQVLMEAIGTRWPAFVIDLLIQSLDRAHTYRTAEELVAPLQPFFARMTRKQAASFAEKSIQNAQIWAAALCRSEYLPEFLRLNRRRLDVEIRKALTYQVEHQSWYSNRNL